MGALVLNLEADQFEFDDGLLVGSTLESQPVGVDRAVVGAEEEVAVDNDR